ncbi:tRNA (adenosine(37)-N6)-threonylcarbamoyltransferase complex dimerization subunit type 1 TsaB [Aromatoleum aromaticum]|uniref:Probable glycoprotease n=1 Tax=Aromatoleum aromaticum (strain DSM 19018 / LMG 30748 / EbN1) TaxID=76114 RepID=Q5NYN0_AROAE|nr:tRNA (adenosine(37)-N6)-threonylcarbamoyltransferase complex dimerization subunit type 1 TsaB [Aromatoleum aromaticum]NMG53358.1 tRNA (adenosine(37)-N6)-threonylcarbamoyltransferase complex dimerization subunit type 1 TsaB [Aromatoleum aromaticum]CAI09834.1 probable glycoprotease [Aromatoleum aromaticum EbN1]
MKILAIETSCERASVALLVDDDIVEHRLEGHANHSEYLLPTLRALLGNAGLPIATLDAIAFGAGPGAFTGLRLACGVAQGLGMGAGIGVVPICSLAALALQGEGSTVFVATDARMGEVYSAAYRVDGEQAIEVQVPACSPPQHLALPAGERWFGVGSAFRVHEAGIPASVTARLSGRNPTAVPRAADIARLAAGEVREGRLLAPEYAVPLYVRDKVALTTAERLARGGRA